METVLFVKSKMIEKSWGGSRLNTYFGLADSGELVGEYWAISAHARGASLVVNGEYAGKKLSEVWHENPTLFGETSAIRSFPLLVKYLNIESVTSIHVHPNDQQARELEGKEYGKDEAALVLEAKDGIFFQGFKGDKSDLLTDFAKGRLQQVIQKSLKVGDFIFSSAGVLHGFRGSMLLIEIQQNSDITYRLHDFNNSEEGGRRRIDTIKGRQVMGSEYSTSKLLKTEHDETYQRLNYGEYEHFSVEVVDIYGMFLYLKEELFTIISVIKGSGQLIIDDAIHEIGIGSHGILTVNVKEVRFVGHLSCLFVTE